MKKLYPLFIAFLLPLLLYAQNDLVVKGLVTVQPNGLLHVEGDVDIQSPSGVLDIQASGSQHGVVEVKIPEAQSPGLWICNGSTTGGGDVQFLGVDVNYEVSGGSVSFPNLILNFGGFPSGGEIFADMTLNNNATVTQSLTLNKGKLVTGSNEVYVSNNASNAIGITGANFGDDKSRFIQGKLKREIAVGNEYIFPIGVDPTASRTGYNPIIIDLSKTGHTVPANATNLTAYFQEQSDIGTVSINASTVSPGSCYFTRAIQYLEFFHMVEGYGYWEVTPNGGYTSGWDYNFYCYPDKKHLFANNFNMNHLKVFKAPNSFTPGPGQNWNSFFNSSGNMCNGVNVVGTWPNEGFEWIPGEGVPSTSTDRIEAWSLTSFSRFGLGGGSGAGLPIELLYLQAYPVNNEYIEVAWATETEINNDYFNVLRSTDGLNFIWIGSVDGAGNSSQRQTYTFKDDKVDPNVLYYYRLKQVDFDETSELTYIVTAMITEASTFTISEFIPNPSENDSRIEVVSSKEEDLNIAVYNTLGQIVMNGDHHVVAGINTIGFDFNLLADGTYYAIIKADNEFFNRKLILTK